MLFCLQHLPKFMHWMKYLSFIYYGFRLLLKVQYSGEQLYECQSKGGRRPLQNSPSFDTVNLDGGLQEVWILLSMALGYRLCAYFCLRKRINAYHIWADSTLLISVCNKIIGDMFEGLWATPSCILLYSKLFDQQKNRKGILELGFKNGQGF